MVYCDTRLGSIRRWYSHKPEDADLPLPFEITNCLGFLVTKKKENKKWVERYEGTAFFVSVPSETDGQYFYLVTARHVVKDVNDKDRATFYLRLNMVDYKRGDIKLTGEWVCSKSKDVDVAVMSIEPPDKNHFIWDAIPYDLPTENSDRRIAYYSHKGRSNMFADQKAIEAYKIGVGDDVRVVGLFSEQAGKERNLPVARSGIIAAMPDEPLEMEIERVKRKFNAYLIEVRSIGGLSGSPVFVLNEIIHYDFEIHRSLPTSDYRYFLLGMIRGSWIYRKQYSLGSVTEKDVDEINLGMAYITPIEDVLDVLYGEELMAQRKKDDEETPKQSRAIAVENSNKSDRKSDDLTQVGFHDALKRASRKSSRPASKKKRT